MREQTVGVIIFVYDAEFDDIHLTPSKVVSITDTNDIDVDISHFEEN